MGARVRRRRPASRSRSPGSPARSARTTRSTPTSRSVLELLDLFQEHLAPPEDGPPDPLRGPLLVCALVVARTTDVPVPELPDAPAPTREETERRDPNEIAG